MTETPLTQRHWIDPLIVIAITLAVFAPVLSTPFSIVDDYLVIVDNADLASPTWEGFRKQWITPQFHLYAPVSYGLMYAIGAIEGGGRGTSPLPFKIASWIIHALASGAAWWVIRLLTPDRAAAIVGAMIVGLHPLQVESVAWTTGLKDLLCGGFSFLTLALYLKYLDARRARWRRLAIAAAITAAMSKPTAALLPLTLIVIDWAMRDEPWRSRIHRLWPFAVVTIFSVATIIVVQHGVGIPRAPLWARPFVAMDSMAFYLFKIVAPANLSIDYARTPQAIIASGAIYWTWIIPAIVFALLLATRSRKLIVAIALFVIPILPVSGLATFDMQQYTTVTDHYAYQSLLAVGLLVAILIGSCRVRVWSGVIILCGLAIVSVNRLILWQDVRVLYTADLARYPRSKLLTESLVSVAIDDQRWSEAETLAKRALEMRHHAGVYDNLAMALEAQGRDVEAAAAAAEVFELNPKLQVQRIQQILRLAARLRDENLAILATRHWIEREPRNPAPLALLKQIEASQNRPTTAPSEGMP